MGRPAVEWCPSAYIGELLRAGALHDADGRRLELVRFELIDAVGDSIGEAEAPVAWLPTPLGGWRPLFCCPRCRHHREWLYALRGVACRQCWGLCYASQKRSKKRRRWERAERACEKLDTDAKGYLVKPKWMRWRTFHRLEAEAGAALDAAPRFMFPERVGTVSNVCVDDV